MVSLRDPFKWRIVTSNQKGDEVWSHSITWQMFVWSIRFFKQSHQLLTSRWFQTIFIFTPKIGEDEPILTIIFLKGLVQPPTRHRFVVAKSSKTFRRRTQQRIRMTCSTKILPNNDPWSPLHPPNCFTREWFSFSAFLQKIRVSETWGPLRSSLKLTFSHLKIGLNATKGLVRKC